MAEPLEDQELGGGQLSEHRMAWSVDEAASLIGISRRLLYELLRSGQLRSVKIGSRRLIRQQDLERFLEELEAA